MESYLRWGQVAAPFDWQGMWSDSEELGFPPGTFTSAGYSTLFCPLQTPHSHVMLCLCLCSVWTLGSPLNSAFHSFPPRKTNRQRGREAEKREKEAEKTKESESSRQTDNIKRQGRGKAVALFLCVFTLPLIQPWARCTAVCPGSDQEIIAGGSDSSSHPAYWGYRLIPAPPRTMKTLHPRVFTQKTAYKGRSIGVNYHRASVSDPTATDMRVNAEPWDPQSKRVCVCVCVCVYMCALRHILCLHAHWCTESCVYKQNMWKHIQVHTHTHTLCGCWLTLDDVCVALLDTSGPGALLSNLCRKLWVALQ